MAELNNANRKSEKNEKKELATDEAGMMIDAKDYAKREMSTVLKVLEKLGFDTTKEELIATALIAVKYEQIDKARNERPTYMSYFE